MTALIATAPLPTPDQADQIVVTTAPPLDVERLADALRVYLDGFGIRVETRAPSDAADLRRRLDDARALGEAVRAFAVIRAERGARGTVEIELTDLATGKALLATVLRPARDEDLYRALALKIQAVLRATISEARDELDPRSSLGRLVTEPVSVSPPPTAPARFGLDLGYDVVDYPSAQGPRFDGLAVRGSWRPRAWLEIDAGTAALGAARATRNDVAVEASLLPLRAAARARLAWGRAELLGGPCLQVQVVHVTATSAATSVRSTRDVTLALGAEAEARLVIAASGWLYARFAALGVVDGARYDVGGEPVLDASGLLLAATVGVGIGLP
jgi:hypothetical protein